MFYRGWCGICVLPKKTNEKIEKKNVDKGAKRDPRSFMPPLFLDIGQFVLWPVIVRRIIVQASVDE